jgi:redox-sensing transcriptional repressor
MGNLGSALFTYHGFKEMRLNIVAVFDTDPKKIGKTIKGIKIYHPKDIPLVIKRLKIDIAIIAVPALAATEITNKLIKSGVRAILNFAPVKLSAPLKVKLRNVDLSSELINLTYFLANQF